MQREKPILTETELQYLHVLLASLIAKFKFIDPFTPTPQPQCPLGKVLWTVWAVSRMNGFSPVPEETLYSHLHIYNKWSLLII